MSKKTWKYAVREPIIDGDIALIPLTQGKVAIIDVEDLPLVAGWNWCAMKAPCGLWYAYNSGLRKVRLHQVILPHRDGFNPDHRDGDGLNNRKNNLRYATALQNSWNRKKRRDSVSKHKGVTKHGARWRARISVGDVRISLGSFLSELEAAEAYLSAARSHFGEFAERKFDK